MVAADSDKDSKSSELTIGPSCIQFQLIIVKVEKFQSAISAHSCGIRPFLCVRASWLGSPSPLLRGSECSFFFFPRIRVPFPAFVSTSSGLSHDALAGLRFPFYIVYTTKLDFPVSALATGGAAGGEKCVF